jgi:hypothetical protein
MDEAVRGYTEAIPSRASPPLDRLHRLILAAYPDAAVVLSYGMPTYKVGTRGLYVGTWKHGVSIYGWEQERAADFIARHPALKTSNQSPTRGPPRQRYVPHMVFG